MTAEQRQVLKDEVLDWIMDGREHFYFNVLEDGIIAHCYREVWWFEPGGDPRRLV